MGVLRLATEYEFMLCSKWSLEPVLMFDLKSEYSSWALFLSAGYRF
jgi:hypothetical protein